jgi:hypothetical protein
MQSKKEKNQIKWIERKNRKRAYKIDTKLPFREPVNGTLKQRVKIRV